MPAILAALLFITPSAHATNITKGTVFTFNHSFSFEGCPLEDEEEPHSFGEPYGVQQYALFSFTNGKEGCWGAKELGKALVQRNCQLRLNKYTVIEKGDKYEVAQVSEDANGVTLNLKCLSGCPHLWQNFQPNGSPSIRCSTAWGNPFQSIRDINYNNLRYNLGSGITVKEGPEATEDKTNVSITSGQIKGPMPSGHSVPTMNGTPTGKSIK